MLINNKLIYFPIKFPDEELRSLVFRYHRDSSNESFLKTKTELFNASSEGNYHNPKGINTLLERLDLNNESRSQFVNDHTYIPYLKIFTPELKHNELFISPSRFCRTTISKLTSSKVKYCPECIWEDYESFKECYLHRTHQLSFLDSCPKHHIPLISECQTCSAPFAFNHETFLLSEPQCRNGHEIQNLENSNQNQFSIFLLSELRDVSSCLSPIICSEVIFKVISQILYVKGYKTDKSIKRTDLVSDLISYIPNDQLIRLGMPINFNNKAPFSTDILSGPNHVGVHPIFYLLLLIFLANSSSVKELIQNQMKVINNSQQNDVWQCINSICPYFGNKTITKENGVHFSRGTVTLRCPFCGAAYKIPIRNNTIIKQENHRIWDRGVLWKSRFVTLVNNNTPRKAIMDELECKSAVYKKHLANYRKDPDKFFEIKSRLKSSLIVNHNDIEINEIKQKILGILQEKPHEMTKTEIKNKIGGHQYYKLLQFDKKWMLDHLPVKKDSILKLNVEEIDKKLYEETEKTIKDIFMLNPPNIITRASIINKLSKLSKNRLNYGVYSYKYIQTNKLIQDNLESRDAYLRRIFPIALQRIKMADYPYTFYNVGRVFSVYRYCSEEIKQWVIEQLVLLSKNKEKKT